MASRTVTRAHVVSISNQRQVRADLDSLGFAASKLWNIARWTADRIWSEIGIIPGHAELSSYLKNDERYADLNAQSSQRVIQELAEAFHSWYGYQRNGNETTNPPDYRKHGDQHPRSTVTFKEDGFKHDAENERVRLSKGRNLKESWSDFILCEYEADPDIAIENVQQVAQSTTEVSGGSTSSVATRSIRTHPVTGLPASISASRTSPPSRSVTRASSTRVVR